MTSSLTPEKKIKELQKTKANSNNHVKMVTSEEEIVELAKQGYDCQLIGENKWLMKKANKSKRTFAKLKREGRIKFHIPTFLNTVLSLSETTTLINSDSNKNSLFCLNLLINMVGMY